SEWRNDRRTHVHGAGGGGAIAGLGMDRPRVAAHRQAARLPAGRDAGRLARPRKRPAAVRRAVDEPARGNGRVTTMRTTSDIYREYLELADGGPAPRTPRELQTAIEAAGLHYEGVSG